MLAGSTAGQGEIAANIENPYDRKGQATTAITKTGTGRWTLSGTNTCAGPTSVVQGTLSLARRDSLAAGSEVSVADGAALELLFRGEIRVGRLTLGGKIQPAGTYGAANAQEFLRGPGVLKNSDSRHATGAAP